MNFHQLGSHDGAHNKQNRNNANSEDDDHTPVRVPDRLQLRQYNQRKVQNTLRQKYGQQHDPAQQLSMPQSLIPSHNTYSQSHIRKFSSNSPRGAVGRLPSASQTIQPQLQNQNKQLAVLPAAALIPKSPRPVTKSFNAAPAQGQLRHVRISSDEFDVRDPRCNGSKAAASQQAIQDQTVSIYKSHMASGQQNKDIRQHGLGGGPQTQNDAQARGNDAASQRRQQQSPDDNQSSSYQYQHYQHYEQFSSSSDDDDRMTDMSECNGTKAWLINQPAQPTMPLYGSVRQQMAGAHASSARLLPPESPGRSNSFQFSPNLMPPGSNSRAQQQQDLAMPASAQVDVPAHRIMKLHLENTEDEMALIFQSQIQANLAESVIPEGTSMPLNATDNRSREAGNPIHQYSKDNTTLRRPKEGLLPVGSGRRFLEEPRKPHHAVGADQKVDRDDILIIKRNNAGSKNAPTLDSAEAESVAEVEKEMAVPTFEAKEERRAAQMQGRAPTEAGKEQVPRGNQSASRIRPSAADLQSPVTIIDGASNALDHVKILKPRIPRSPNKYQYQKIGEQVVEVDENDEEILNYSQCSNTKKSKKTGDSGGASERSKEQQPAQELGNVFRPETDPYGLHDHKLGSANDRANSSFLASKLELRLNNNEAAMKFDKFDQSEQTALDLGQSEPSKKSLADHSNNQGDRQLPQSRNHRQQQNADAKVYAAQKYNAEAQKSNAELMHSGKDLVKSGIALSSPFFLSQDMGSEVEASDYDKDGLLTAEFNMKAEGKAENRNVSGSTSQQPSRPQTVNQLAYEAWPPRNAVPKKGPWQDPSDLLVVVPQASGPRQPPTQLHSKMQEAQNRKPSKIMEYEVKKPLAPLKEHNNESLRSDEETKTAPKVKGRVQADSQLNLGSRTQLLGADGEVSVANIMANSNRIDSLMEWNNLDHIESSIQQSQNNTPRDSNVPPRSTRARSPSAQPQEPEQIIDQHVTDKMLAPQYDRQQTISQQQSNNIYVDTQIPSGDENTRNIFESKIQRLSSERSSANQADYKKFVYSPRAQNSLDVARNGNNLQIETKDVLPQVVSSNILTDQEMADLLPANLASRPDDAATQNLLDPSAVNFQEADRLMVVVTGSEKVGKSTLIEHLGKGQQVEGLELVVQSGDKQMKAKLVEKASRIAHSDVGPGSGYVVMFDMTNRTSMDAAQVTVKSIRESPQRSAPIVCLAHKVEGLIELSDEELKQRGVSEEMVAQFSKENSVRVFKTSLKVPQSIDVAFQSLLAEMTGLRAESLQLIPTSQAPVPTEVPDSAVEQEPPNVDPEAQNEVDIHVELQAQNITNIHIRNIEINNTQSMTMKSLIDNLDQQEQQQAESQISSQKKGSSTEREAKLSSQKIKPTPARKRQRNALAPRRASTRSLNEPHNSAQPTSIYEQLLHKKAWKSKNGMLKSKKHSVASLSSAAGTELWRANKANQARCSPSQVVVGDHLAQTNTTRKKSNLSSRKSSARNLFQRADSKNSKNSNRGDPYNIAKTKDVQDTANKKKAKKKTYKRLFESVQRLSKKRSSAKTDGPKVGAKGRDQSLDSDTVKLNLKKFNKLICADIARTRDRMSSRQGHQSIANSARNTPMKNSCLNINSNINSDLPSHGALQAQTTNFRRQHYQTVIEPKSKTEAKRSQSKDGESERGNPFPRAHDEAEAQDASKLKCDYANDAKAYINVVDDLKHTLNTDAEISNRYNTYSNRDSFVNPTRNSKEQSEAGRPSHNSNGRDTFKESLRTEQLTADHNELEVFMDSKGSAQVSSELQIRQRRQSKLTEKAALTEMPKFGDQSSISRDEQASTTLAVAADSSSLQRYTILEPSNKVSTYQRPSITISASKLTPSGKTQAQSEVQLKLKQKLKQRRRARVPANSDLKGKSRSPAAQSSEYQLMSDQKLRSKFHDMMKQNKTRPSVNQSDARGTSATLQSQKLQTASKTVGSKGKPPPSLFVGDRKFVTQYRDPSLRGHLGRSASEQTLQVQAIPAAAEPIIEAKSSREKKQRAAKIGERLKNIDRLESDASNIQAKGSLMKLTQLNNPSDLKQKKNFREMFSEVKVLEFNTNTSAKKTRKSIFNTQTSPISATERDSPQKKDTPCVATKKAVDNSIKFSSSLVSEVFQDRYLTMHEVNDDTSQISPLKSKSGALK